MASPREHSTRLKAAPALRAVVQLNRVVAGRARQGYAAQGICMAISTAAVTAALAVLNGSDLERPDLLVLALILGSLTFFMWRRENAVSDGAVAARVDGELALRGAYLAAHEAGREPDPSLMSELGAERVLAGISRGEVLEVATPHTLAFVGLPLTAVAVLVVCVGARGESGGSGQGDRARSFALSSDLAALARDGAGVMDDATREELERAAASAASGATAGRRRDQMREVAEELEALAMEAPPGSELAEALAKAAATAESMSLEPGNQEPGAPPERQSSSAERDSGDPRGARREGEADRRRLEGADEAAATSGVGPGGLAPSGDDPDRPDRPGPESTGTEAGEVPGALAGGVSLVEEASVTEEPSTRTILTPRWWDRRDERLVSRWVAQQRAAGAPGGSGSPGGAGSSGGTGARGGAESPNEAQPQGGVGDPSGGGQ